MLSFVNFIGYVPESDLLHFDGRVGQPLLVNGIYLMLDIVIIFLKGPVAHIQSRTHLLPRLRP